MALLLVAAGCARASQEGILPLSSFRLESLGIGESGRVVVTVTEEGKIEVGAVENRDVPSTRRPPSLLPPSSGPSPPAASLARPPAEGGQAAKEDRSEALRILVPRHCATDRLLMVTHLTGPFGGRGDFIRGIDGQTSYLLPLYPSGKDPSVGASRAETVRIIAYCPGQQIATLELPDLDDLKSHEVAMPFIALPARRVQCRVEFPEDVPKRPFELVAYYRAYSGNEFLRISHGFVPQFEVLRTLVPESGEAQLMIPDFSRDRFTTNQTFGNSISFSAVDPNTKNPGFDLSPKEMPAHEALPDTLILRASPNLGASDRGD